MSGLDRRFGSGSRQDPNDDPGLLIDDENDTYVVDRNGVRWLLPGTGGGGNTPPPTAPGQILYSADGITWVTLSPTADGDILTLDAGLPAWEPPSGVSDDALPLAVLFGGL